MNYYTESQILAMVVLLVPRSWAKKSKLMLLDTYETSSMTMNGKEFMCTNQEVHFGNVIGTCNNGTKNVINNATNNFIK